MLLFHPAQEGHPTADDAREVLAALAARPEFGAPAPDLVASALAWIAERLARLGLGALFGGGDGRIGPLVVLGLVGVAVGVLLVVVARRLWRFRNVAAPAASPVRPAAVPRSREWLADADRAFAEGRSRDAFAALYGAAVRAIGERGLVDVREWKLAGAYGVELGGAPEAGPFLRVARETYAVLFGARDPGRERFERVRAEVAGLAPTGDGGGAAP